MAKYTSTHTGSEIDSAVDKAAKLPTLTSSDNGKTLQVNSSGNIVANTVSAGGISEISTQYIRITDLNPGVYKLTYSGTKYIYYYGTSSTSTHTVTGGTGAVVLTVSKYTTTYWHWWYINGTTSYATLYYGYTSTSSGSTGSKSLTDLKTTDNNYYPTRSYTSGLQISSYSGSSSCALYVPYASSSQYGCMQPGTGLTASSGVINIDYLPVLTTAPSSANSNGIKIVYLTSEPSTKYAGYLYLIKSGS